jgi:hypothetical protein
MSWLGTFYCWLAVGICFDHDEDMASGEKSRFAVSAGRVGPGIILPRRLYTVGLRMTSWNSSTSLLNTRP